VILLAQRPKADPLGEILMGSGIENLSAILIVIAKNLK